MVILIKNKRVTEVLNHGVRGARILRIVGTHREPKVDIYEYVASNEDYTIMVAQYKRTKPYGK